MKRIVQIAILVAIVMSNGRLQAEFVLPHILSDNMMLQRDKPARIWGMGDDGTTVTVTFKDQNKSAAVRNGEWLVTLDAEPHGGSFEMKITDGSDSRAIRNILIGEVWQASGQSNMQSQ